MPRWPALSVAFALTALAVGRADAASSGSRNSPDKDDVAYKWIDEKGVTHYGDYVPPEYAKRERAVLNEEGVVIRRLDAEKTAEQRAAEARQQRDIASRQQHDKFLLTTYTSVRDIESLRDQRLAQLSDQRGSTEVYIESLNDRLAQLQLRAQTFRPYNASPGAKPMPDKLAEDLIRSLNEVRRQRQVLDDRRNEEIALRAQFQSDIDRYRLLRSGATASR